MTDDALRARFRALVEARVNQHDEGPSDCDSEVARAQDDAEDAAIALVREVEQATRHATLAELRERMSADEGCCTGYVDRMLAEVQP
jgi:hypothetical protein